MTPGEAKEILLNHTQFFVSSEDLEALSVAFEALCEVEKYREIGTIEECREAVEKQKPKDPDYEGDGKDRQAIQ